jgi:hypothetical protein
MMLKDKFRMAGIAFVSIFAFSVSGQASDEGQKTLARIDALQAFMDTDFSAEYTMAHIIPGEGSTTTVAAVIRRDKESKLLAVILKPDSGKAYLKIGRIIWVYDPKDGSMIEKQANDTITIANLSLADIVASTLAIDYDVVSSSRGEAFGQSCLVLDIKAKKSGIQYQKRRLWISDDGLLRREEDWSSTQLMRTIEIPSYQKVSGKYVPASVAITNNLRGKAISGKTEFERTEVRIAKVSFAAVKDAYFTQEFLRSRKK